MTTFYMAPVTIENVFMFIVFAGIGASVFPVTFWSMVPDTVEYGQWKSGVRAESFVFGMTTLAQKIALGIGVGLLGLLLEFSGFAANEALSHQTENAIKALMTLMPLLGVALSALFIFFYPLSQQLHAKMVRELSQRNSPTPTRAH
jgi:GPH family glycoside/pentoside/hexuronide:cation symporter